MKNILQLPAAAKMSKIKYLTTCQDLFIPVKKVKLSAKNYSRLHKRIRLKNIAANVTFYEYLLGKKLGNLFIDFLYQVHGD